MFEVRRAAVAAKAGNPPPGGSDERAVAPTSGRDPLPTEPDAFEARVRPHVAGLHRFCLSLTRDRTEAEDLFQEALLRAFLNAPSYSGEGTLLGWLCTIARHDHLERRRVAARRQGLFDRVRTGVSEVLGSVFGGGDDVSPERALLANERSERFLEALRRLPEPHRLVLALVEVEGLTYAEAAVVLELPVGTVKSRHARGRAKLVAEFTQLWGDEP